MLCTMQSMHRLPEPPGASESGAHRSEMIKNRLWLFYTAAASGKMSEFRRKAVADEIIKDRYYYTGKPEPRYIHSETRTTHCLLKRWSMA